MADGRLLEEPMPIYEYRCGACKRRVSVFFRSFSAVGEATCPRCGSADLTRLMSRVAVVRGGESGGEDGGDGDDDLDPTGMLAGLDEDDPRAIARWARRMSDEMGEPMEPEFEEALTRIEAGEDPERVMEQVDGEAGGEDGGVDEW
jgi:putative FmdB family regulatory protein